VVRLVAVVSCLVESTCTAVSMLQFDCPKSCLDELSVTRVDGSIQPVRVVEGLLPSSVICKKKN
jgi:hypothetical protein